MQINICNKFKKLESRFTHHESCAHIIDLSAVEQIRAVQILQDIKVYNIEDNIIKINLPKCETTVY